ncbi:hypothetical protein CRES_0306 [Corynebacterium resistens DSM 45100]|uniref:Uncharacterized protein n=1 Tax=Corynebacterium resistens (strain DSM 45100 / JCM 12819 / GTC 2026 / SICGH 158) TaxID=662755 RepID=F8E2X1_CORRG|nr:hypothetical protein [Corynebacterium resistens]AEI08669.1 hypothetical protein CRES_0306 [Corynebacterium resistens DSM 45100]
MNTHITINEAALTRRMTALSDESRQLRTHAHAVGGIAMPASADVGRFPSSARRWLTMFSETAVTHADDLRECAQQVVNFAQTARAQDRSNASGLQLRGHR